MADFDEIGLERYLSVMKVDGVRTTMCENRFEITVQPDCKVWEQTAVKMLRDWIRTRQQKQGEQIALFGDEEG